MKDHPEKPSQIFEEAFRGGFGGCTMTCNCGRELFDTANSYDWETGELEELKSKAAADPAHYIALDYCASALCIDGKTFVLGCPCNQARLYEDWIRRHAEPLVKFLVAVKKEREDHAQALLLADKLVNFPPVTGGDQALGITGYPTQSF